jgi:mannose-6-phosphate isomerase-like protein (cupin superfamily)
MDFPSKRPNKEPRINKGWGEEVIIHNDPNYCTKILNLKQGGECSLHLHLEKHETFLVLVGEVEIELSFNLKRESLILKEGESIDIPARMAHKFKALKTSTLLEASNHDKEEEDIIRLEGGDTQKTRPLPIGNTEFNEWETRCKRIAGRS